MSQVMCPICIFEWEVCSVNLSYSLYCIHILHHALLLSIGVFYFLLGNLHPKYRSKLKSIQLVALCKNRYIKKYPLNAILAPIVSHLKKLVRNEIYNHTVIFIAALAICCCRS